MINFGSEVESKVKSEAELICAPCVTCVYVVCGFFNFDERKKQCSIDSVLVGVCTVTALSAGFGGGTRGHCIGRDQIHTIRVVTGRLQLAMDGDKRTP